MGIHESPSKENEISKNAPILPVFSRQNLSLVFQKIEIGGKPRSLESVISSWTSILQSHMKYDAVNYSLFRDTPLDTEQGGFIDKLDLRSLSINSAQREILRKTLESVRKNLQGDYLDEYVKGVLDALEGGNMIDLVEALISSPTLQRFLLSDPEFSRAWHGLYIGKSVPEVLRFGIGNCKSLSVMSKILLEEANRRYNFSIRKIEIIQNDEFHVYLKITTPKGIFEYDPTSIFYLTDKK